MIVLIPCNNLAVGDADIRPPCMLCGLFCVCQNDDCAQVSVHAHVVTQLFFGHCRHLFNVCHECLPPVEIFPRNVDKLSSDVRRLRSFRSLCDGGEKLVDLVLIHQLKIAVVCRPEDWICYVPSGDFGYSLCNPLLDSNGRKAEDVLTI